MNNINRFQGQGHRFGGNQNLNRVRVRPVGQQAAQVAANALQQNAQQAAQVAVNAQPVAQVLGPLPAPPQIPAQQLQVLAQQNLQAMQVNNHVQNYNQRMANFVQNIIQEYGPLPENIEKLTNPEMDHFVFDRNRLQDIGNLATYLKDVVKNTTITSAQCFNALPNEDGDTILDNYFLSRKLDINNGHIHLFLSGISEFTVAEHEVKCFDILDEKSKRQVTINLAHNDNYEILNGLVSYRKSQIGSKLSVEDPYQPPIVTIENTRNAKTFHILEKVDGWSRYKQDLNFDDQGILTSHLIQDSRGNISYDVLNNSVTTRNRVIDLGQNPNLLAEVVTGNIMESIKYPDYFKVYYNVSIPFNQVNSTGTMQDLITHHNEVMSQLPRNGFGIIDNDVQIIDLTDAGNRAEAIEGDWNNGYIYYDEDGNKKYEYIKNIDGQGNNQIRTYHPDIEVPSFDIVTQSNLEDLGSATYTYNRYDRRGDTMVQNEQIVNNDVADTIAFNITPIINQLATNNDRETVAEINELLLRKNVYNPAVVFHTIESIR